MKVRLISDSNDTLIGLRLVGIEGTIAAEKEEIINEFKKLSEDKEVGLVLITEKVNALCEDFFTERKLSQSRPLITVIPGYKTDGVAQSSIMKCVNEAIGVKM